MNIRSHNAGVTNTIIIAIALAASAVFYERAAADTVFFDGTFANPDWSQTLQTNGTGGTSSAAQAASGGNPGSYYQVDISTNGNGPGGVSAFYGNVNFNFTPSTQGAIFSLDFAIDLKTISTAAFANVAVMQNGNVYFAPEDFTTSGAWTSFSQPGLTANAFVLAAPAPNGEMGGDPSQHPDFSSTGSTIEFGFTDNANTLSNGFAVTFGVDNYSVSLSTADVPEASTWLAALLSAAVIFTSAWQRRFCRLRT